MKDVSDFLKKFRLLIKDSGEQKQKVAQILKPFCNHDITPDEIEFRQRRIYLKTNKIQPVEKNSIFLNKREVLDKIKKETGLKFDDVGF